jgi:hypothetical protein
LRRPRRTVAAWCRNAARAKSSSSGTAEPADIADVSPVRSVLTREKFAGVPKCETRQSKGFFKKKKIEKKRQRQRQKKKLQSTIKFAGAPAEPPWRGKCARVK